MNQNGWQTRYVLAISGMLLIGAGLLYGYLTISQRDVPPTLLIFLGGALLLLRTYWVQEKSLGMSQQTADKADANAELLRVIKDAIHNGQENMAYITDRFEAIEGRLIERTARFDRIEAKLDKLAEGE